MAQKYFFNVLRVKLGFDKAIIFGSLTQVWNLVAGFVTLLLVANRFSPVLQGYYYTFNSVLALTVFVEFGLGVVIQQYASHEWSRLSIDVSGRIVGDVSSLSRLGSLLGLSIKWYGIAGAIAATGLGISGFVFFSQRAATEISWSAPWLVLCLVTGVKLILIPTWSILDGCNQMQVTNKARLLINSSTSIACWVAILVGGGLWTLAAVCVTNIIFTVLFILKRYWLFFKSLVRGRSASKISWKNDIWPMQWKIGLSWLSGYLLFSLFTPVMFQFQGAVVAGQMGMTISLANALSALSYSWINTKIPIFGILIARREYESLDKIYSKATRQALVVNSLGAVAGVVVVLALSLVSKKLSMRFLPLPLVSIFFITTLITTFIGSMAAYLRAHKQEPYLVTSVCAGIVIAFSTIILGSKFGATGAVVGYFILNMALLLPSIAIFKNKKRIWHIR